MAAATQGVAVAVFAATPSYDPRCTKQRNPGECSVAMSDSFKQTSQDASEQIAQLREQVQSLMNDRVAPALSHAADTAQQYASQAREVYENQAEALSERVREAPIMAILVAAGIGYVIGRIAR